MTLAGYRTLRTSAYHPEPTYEPGTERQILTTRSEAMLPKGFEPKDDKSRREDCCPEHDAKRGERLLLACRKPGQVLLN